jgi:2-polyprenyl-3-methyl-5-hydroxy-6-metoxy-1,4-benzoquinol methylase
VAEWYDALVGDEGSEYQREVILPGIMRMLKIENRKSKTEKGESGLEGIKVLDLACGQGVLCRKLAAAGCDVVGIDAAEPLIAAARRRNDADRMAIAYRVGDATKLLVEGKLAAGLEAESFDAVTIVLAIQNITPLSPVWQACRAVLKAGGALVVVMMHPAFRVPRESDWIWDEKTQTQGRVTRQYLSSSTIPIQTHPGLAAHGKSESTTTHFHRPLQAYINTLGNAGLLIDHVEEWASHKTSQAGPRKAALDKARKEIPMFLALRARKLNSEPRP